MSGFRILTEIYGFKARSFQDSFLDIKLTREIHQESIAPPLSVLSAQRLTFQLQVEGKAEDGRIELLGIIPP